MYKIIRVAVRNAFVKIESMLPMSVPEKIEANFFPKSFYRKQSQSRSDFGSYETVLPGNVSQIKICPPHIKVPPYCNTPDFTEEVPLKPDIKDASQINAMRQSCKLAKKVLDAAGKFAKIGVTTDQIDEFVHNLIIENNAYPSPLLYHGFPKSVCTSVNNVACHGIPDDRPLRDGDIISIDVSVYLNGYHGDCASTYLIGDVDKKGRELVMRSRDLLMRGVEICGPGVQLSMIGFKLGYGVRNDDLVIIPDGCGHGIGAYFHGPPTIYHFENQWEGIMKPGMTFTIEPVIGQGLPEIEMLDDEWTIVTVDDSRTAQFEHTVLITDTGFEILTD